MCIQKFISKNEFSRNMLKKERSNLYKLQKLVEMIEGL